MSSSSPEVVLYDEAMPNDIASASSHPRVSLPSSGTGLRSTVAATSVVLSESVRERLVDTIASGMGCSSTKSAEYAMVGASGPFRSSTGSSFTARNCTVTSVSELARPSNSVTSTWREPAVGFSGSVTVLMYVAVCSTDVNSDRGAGPCRVNTVSSSDPVTVTLVPASSIVKYSFGESGDGDRLRDTLSKTLSSASVTAADASKSDRADEASTNVMTESTTPSPAASKTGSSLTISISTWV